MIYIPECKSNTCKCEILHTLSMDCCCITLREPCNNQRPRCDIVWLHVTNHLFHGFPSLTVYLGDKGDIFIYSSCGI